MVLPGNALSGLAGDTPVKPRKVERSFGGGFESEVHAVSIFAAVTFGCPVSVTVRLAGATPTFGIRMSMNNSPVWVWPPPVKVKLLGGFVGIGVTVPLSAQAGGTPTQNPCRACALPVLGANATTAAAPISADTNDLIGGPPHYRVKMVR